jgi:hypothetical protein
VNLVERHVFERSRPAGARSRHRTKYPNEGQEVLIGTVMMRTNTGRPDPAATAADPPTRVIGRRTGLPSGRAVLGALLVSLAAVGVFALTQRADTVPTTAYAVFVRPLDPGDRITAADLELRPMTLDQSLRAHAFTDTATLVGAVALVPSFSDGLVFGPHVMLRQSGAGEVPSSVHEFSFPVPRDRTPPALRRGETVAVLATYGSGGDAITVVAVERARVLAYETDGDAIGTRGGARITVALDDPQTVLATAHAAQVADLTVVRTTLTDQALPSQYRRASEVEERRRP